MIREIRKWFEEVLPERARANPRSIQRMRATVVFRITGDGGETWTVRIEDPSLRAEAAEAPRPDLTLTLDRETFLGIANGSLTGADAYKAGRVKVAGNLLLGLQLAPLLDAHPPSPSDDFV